MFEQKQTSTRLLQNLLGISFAQAWSPRVTVDNSRCFLSRLPLPRSSEVASGASAFLRNQFFHACGDFFMFQHFTTIDLRQSFFDLADEQLIVSRQPQIAVRYPFGVTCACKVRLTA